jgi:hypothetical protein
VATTFLFFACETSPFCVALCNSKQANGLQHCPLLGLRLQQCATHLHAAKARTHAGRLSRLLPPCCSTLFVSPRQLPERQTQHLRHGRPVC